MLLIDLHCRIVGQYGQNGMWGCFMEGKSVLMSVSGRSATITLNRPDKLNPLDWSTLRELDAALDRIESLDGIEVVVVTGAGRAFSAGGDLDGYVGLYRQPDQFRLFLDDFFRVLDRMEASPRIFIAAVNGACVAGGLELLLACDLSVAAREAKIGDGHLNFGQLPGAGGSQRLPRMIGAMRAKYLMLTGRLLSGEEAERIGLVSLAVPAGELPGALARLTERVLAMSPLGVKGVKYLVNEGMQRPLAEALRMEIEFVHDYATTSADAMEGLLAFRDKRSPAFIGR